MNSKEDKDRFLKELEDRRDETTWINFLDNFEFASEEIEKQAKDIQNGLTTEYCKLETEEITKWVKQMSDEDFIIFRTTIETKMDQLRQNKKAMNLVKQ